MENIKLLPSIFRALLLGLVFIGGTEATAQEHPPIPIEVELRNAQGLSFGAFTVGALGGKVLMSTNGSRTSQNDIILLDMGLTPTYAIFDIYTNPGTLIHILPPSPVTLVGPYSNSLTLTINPLQDISTQPAQLSGNTFITTQNPHPMYIGGTLEVPAGSGDFSGIYSGTFMITLIHE